MHSPPSSALMRGENGEISQQQMRGFNMVLAFWTAVRTDRSITVTDLSGRRSPAETCSAEIVQRLALGWRSYPRVADPADVSCCKALRC